MRKTVTIKVKLLESEIIMRKELQKDALSLLHYFNLPVYPSKHTPSPWSLSFDRPRLDHAFVTYHPSQVDIDNLSLFDFCAIFHEIGHFIAFKDNQHAFDYYVFGGHYDSDFIIRSEVVAWDIAEKLLEVRDYWPTIKRFFRLTRKKALATYGVEE